VNTSRAIGANSSLARTTARSREFLVEQHELQQLPPSAMIVSYASPHGRRVVMADANPGILALPTATLHSLEELRESAPMAAGPVLARAVRPGPARPDAAGDEGNGAGARPEGPAGSGPVPPPSRDPAAAPVSWRDAEDKLPANLGPPPEPLPGRPWSRGRCGPTGTMCSLGSGER
jgi:hypothetical protein